MYYFNGALVMIEHSPKYSLTDHGNKATMARLYNLCNAAPNEINSTTDN